MAVTSPDNIWTPDSGDDYALTVDLARMADDVQDALNATQRTRGGAGEPSGTAAEGDTYRNSANGYVYKYLSGGWNLWDTPQVSLTSLNTGWTAALAPNNPYIYARSGVAYIQGGVIYSAGADQSNILTVPAPFRPVVSGVHWVGTGQGPTSNPFVGGLGMSNTGVLSFTRLNLSPVATASAALSANWKINK